MDGDLSEEEGCWGKGGNGKMSKKVERKYGEVSIESGGEGEGSLEGERVKKGESIVGNGMGEEIIEM